MKFPEQSRSGLKRRLADKFLPLPGIMYIVQEQTIAFKAHQQLTARNIGADSMEIEVLLLMLVALEFKHFIFDFILQNGWMIHGKGSLTKAGGYVHAGLHVFGTIVALAMFGLPAALIAIIAVAEFVIHYIVDFIKANLGDDTAINDTPHRFWAMIGLDQFLHHLTYVGIIYFVAMQTLG